MFCDSDQLRLNFVSEAPFEGNVYVKVGEMTDGQTEGQGSGDTGLLRDAAVLRGADGDAGVGHHHPLLSPLRPPSRPQGPLFIG